TDGLPLAGAQFGELNLAQVPPLDLRRVEVIKGPATALYGPSAMAGVVNLVTRPPTETERDIVVNQTSQSGSDAVGWFSQHFNDHWGATLLAGAHHQSEDDVNGDGWADVAGFRRLEVRPRIYWAPRAGTSLLATAGGMTEYRIGGTIPGALLPNDQPFPTSANTNRADGGVIGVTPLFGRDTLAVRASRTVQWNRENFGPETYYSSQHGRHGTTFSEATVTIPMHAFTWLVGGGFEQDAFHSTDLSGFDYTYNDPSAFAQGAATFGRFSLTASGRCDWHSRFGTICSPRVSALLRATPAWSIRLAGATGFFAPTPFIDETEGVPLGRFVPFNTTTIATC